MGMFSATDRTGKRTGFGSWPALLPALLFVLFLAGCAAKQTPDDGKGYLLTVMHSNDTHSAYGGTNDKGMLCYAALCGGGKGGRVRMQQAARAVRAENPDALFLDAGDAFQGSLYWTLHKEAVPAAVLDMMGYQAIIPGNHEFDAGCKPFLEMVRALKTPVLAANLSFTPPLEGSARVLPWVVLERGGRIIGIVGIANAETPNLASPCPEARFADETETLRAAVKELEAQGVNIIIAITHIGLETDKRLARAVTGVDVIVGGHSHSLISNKQPKAEGPYPVVERSADGKPVLVVTAASATAYLGRLDVRFDRAGVPVSWEGEPIPLDDAALKAMNAPAPDPELVRVLETFSEPVRKMMTQPFGRITAEGREGKPLEDPNVLQCREGECLTGDITADALLGQAFPTAQAAIINGGALRNSLPGGPITPGDVLATLPFQNTPLMASMPGSVLLQALEHSVSAYGEGKGSFLQTSGLRYVFDPKKEPGRRIVRAEIRDKNGAWRPVNPKTSYNVVTVDFLAGGGDGFAMFKPLKWHEADMLMNDALRLHLEKNSPLAPKIEGRIRRIN